MNAEHEALLRKGNLIKAAREAADALREKPQAVGMRADNAFRDFHPGNKYAKQWSPSFNIGVQNEEERTIFLTAFRERLLEIRAEIVRRHEHELGGLDALVDGRAMSSYDDKWRSTLRLYMYDGEHFAGARK